jgi:SAM-dependent methyltransferase
VTARRSRRVFDHVRAPAPRYLMRLALIEEAVAMLPPDVGSFLEIGPGLGDLSLFLAERYPRATATLVDLSERSAGVLAERVGGRPRFTIRSGDVTDLEPASPVDLVVACEVFEHIEDEDAAFAKVRGLLAREGHFLFSVPGAMIPWGAADRFAGHCRRYARADVESRFRRHGFRLRCLWCYGFPLAQLLFPFQELYYRRRIREAATTRLEATKRSGVDRRDAARLRRLPMAALMKPLFWCQHRTRHLDLGDGYVALASPD